MKAVRYHGDHLVTLDEVATPSLGPSDILLAPEAVGVCGTDTHIIEGHFVSAPPMILGHEIAARVVEVGSRVESVRVGELITVEPHYYCGTCFNCQTGTIHMCPNRKAPGVHLDGGMAEFLAVHESLAYRLPDGVPAWQGALTEPIACCVHGMDRLAAKSGMPVAIFGAGPIGVILVALARLAGLGPIVVIEPRAHRRELALQFGADLALDPYAEDFEKSVHTITGGIGFPYIIEGVGHPRVFEQAISIACRAGRILVLGVAAPDAEATVRPNEIYAKELTILGTALNPYTHRRAANLIPRLGLDRLTPGFFALDDFQAALDAQVAGEYDKVFIESQRMGASA